MFLKLQRSIEYSYMVNIKINTIVIARSYVSRIYLHVCDYGNMSQHNAIGVTRFSRCMCLEHAIMCDSKNTT